jgi:hypothetical protein
MKRFLKSKPDLTVSGEDQKPTAQDSGERTLNEHHPQRDVGVAAIDQIFRLWQVDEAWSVRERRGFAWWGGDYRQRVCVDAGRNDNGIFIYKMSAVTDFLRGVDPHDPALAERLAFLNRYSSSYALTLDEGERRVLLFSSVVLHEQNADWIVPHFSALAIIQPIDAQVRAHVGAEMLGGAPDKSGHPSSGVRLQHDDMLNIIQATYRPLGEGPSRWVDSNEFEQVPTLLSKGGFFSTGGRSGLSAEISFGNDSALITASGDERHPQLGHGVCLLLHLPCSLSKAVAARLALELNSADANATAGHLLGSWCSAERRGGNVPVFASFIPNLLYRPGLLFQMILSLGIKARWARNEIAPYMEDDDLERILRRRYGIDGSLVDC